MRPSERFAVSRVLASAPQIGPSPTKHNLQHKSQRGRRSRKMSLASNPKSCNNAIAAFGVSLFTRRELGPLYCVDTAPRLPLYLLRKEYSCPSALKCSNAGRSLGDTALGGTISAGRPRVVLGAVGPTGPARDARPRQIHDSAARTGLFERIREEGRSGWTLQTSPVQPITPVHTTTPRGIKCPVS
jgi:hypothetical protein